MIMATIDGRGKFVWLNSSKVYKTFQRSSRIYLNLMTSILLFFTAYDPYNLGGISDDTFMESAGTIKLGSIGGYNTGTDEDDLWNYY